MEHTVDKQQMEGLQALAQTTMKVSEAKANLYKLEETETEYLVAREQKAMDRIRKVHDDSAALLQETQTNYAEVHQILRTVGEASAFIGEAYTAFKALLTDFEARNEAWEANCKAWEDHTKAVKDALKVERTKIENEKVSIETTKKGIAEDRRKVDDMRQTLDRAIKRLKDNRI